MSKSGRDDDSELSATVLEEHELGAGLFEEINRYLESIGSSSGASLGR